MPVLVNPVLVHDYLLVMRGAERSFAAMCDAFPGAPVATLLYDPSVFETRLAGHPISTSGLQRFGARQRTFRTLLPFFPRAAERLPVQGHDLVISSSSAFAHGVRPDPGAAHVCYCYTPFRYAWHERDVGIAQAPGVARPFVGRTLDRIRRWDYAAAQRGTRYVAISELSRRRIEECWGIETDVVYPPVELDRFHQGQPEDFALVVSELLRHKRVDLALDAARRARVRAIVVGDGTDGARLRSLHGDHATFVGRADDATLASLYARARCLVMPKIEEFGIAAVEAQASGRPVVAIDGGGARETVIDGKTGVLVPDGDCDALADVLAADDLDRMSPAAAVANAGRFSVGAFQDGLQRQVTLARQAVGQV